MLYAMPFVNIPTYVAHLKQVIMLWHNARNEHCTIARAYSRACRSSTAAGTQVGKSKSAVHTVNYTHGNVNLAPCMCTQKSYCRIDDISYLCPIRSKMSCYVPDTKAMYCMPNMSLIYMYLNGHLSPMYWYHKS